MQCFTPLKAYRGHGGGVVFDSKHGFADRPLELKCGQCKGCRLERTRQWALRMMHEAQLHARHPDHPERGGNCFLTLTYDDDHLPPNGSLDVKHWQAFAKKLRKKLGPFRFYHCGEYGDENGRPHLHSCIFGRDFKGDRELFKKTKLGTLHTSELLNATWGHGFATIGELTWQSAAYVARYVMKKQTGKRAGTHYMRVDPETGEYLGELKPEYATMSRRPGIGSAWYEKFKGDVYPDDEVLHAGQRFRPPRFYDKKLEAENPELYEELKKQRFIKAAQHKEDQTPERLQTQLTVLEARLSPLRRNL